MFKKIAKFTGIAVLAVFVLIACFYIYSYVDIRLRASKEYKIEAEAIHISYDTAAIVRGERLTRTRACVDCHGKDMGGSSLVDDPLIGSFVTKNLTRGKGGLPADFSAKDWVLAMKHGLNKDHKPLYLMPSHELSLLTEKDMADIIAYCSQLPPVDREQEEFSIGPLGYVLSELDLIPLLPVEFTNHKLPYAKEIAPAVTAEYGKYIAMMCANCHGPKLKGGESPVPGGKYVADISATGKPGKWTHQQFITALHTGKTPEGKILNPEDMPWTITKNYTEDELTALHLYLLTLK